MPKRVRKCLANVNGTHRCCVLERSPVYPLQQYLFDFQYCDLAKRHRSGIGPLGPPYPLTVELARAIRASESEAVRAEREYELLELCDVCSLGYTIDWVIGNIDV